MNEYNFMMDNSFEPACHCYYLVIMLQAKSIIADP